MIPINVVDETLKIAQELRANGIAADFAMGKKGVSKNLEYANVLKIPYVAIVGEEELKKKKILLKEMSSGTEQLLSLKDLIKKLQKQYKHDKRKILESGWNCSYTAGSVESSFICLKNN